MGVTVVFDYQRWLTRYPEFNPSVTGALAQEYFNEATAYLRNDGGGPVNDATLQLTLLNMLTAHIAWLNQVVNGIAVNPLPGIVTSATEGSVSVQLTPLEGAPASAWYNQTKYGAAFWSAIRGYRTGHYRARPQIVAGAGPWWSR